MSYVSAPRTKFGKKTGMFSLALGTVLSISLFKCINTPRLRVSESIVSSICSLSCPRLSWLRNMSVVSSLWIPTLHPKTNIAPSFPKDFLRTQNARKDHKVHLMLRRKSHLISLCCSFCKITHEAAHDCFFVFATKHYKTLEQLAVFKPTI
jgi:hypothetical protein